MKEDYKPFLEFLKKIRNEKWLAEPESYRNLPSCTPATPFLASGQKGCQDYERAHDTRRAKGQRHQGIEGSGKGANRESEEEGKVNCASLCYHSGHRVFPVLVAYCCSNNLGVYRLITNTVSKHQADSRLFMISSILLALRRLRFLF